VTSWDGKNAIASLAGDNKPNETKYIYRDFDSEGQQLHGKNLYTVTFPKGQTPPVIWLLGTR
jgi:hypothetical protein